MEILLLAVIPARDFGVNSFKRKLIYNLIATIFSYFSYFDDIRPGNPIAVPRLNCSAVTLIVISSLFLKVICIFVRRKYTPPHPRLRDFSLLAT